jgi:hypothetical protein
MTQNVSILVVEDDNSMYEAYQDAAEEVTDQDYKICLIRKLTAESAISSIISNAYDGAIIDLNLISTAPQSSDGNKVIEEIYQKNRFPIKVVSGNLGNLSAKLSNKESPFLKFHDRDSPEAANELIFKSFLDLYKTGITKMLGRRGKLDEMLSQVFWTHLANDIEGWFEPAGRAEPALLRYALSHLNEYLDRDQEYGVNEREFYIKPPIRKHISTGDVVDTDHGKFIVLSPACDVEPRRVENGLPVINAKKIILGPLIQVNRQKWLDLKVIKVDTNTASVKKSLENIVKGQDPKFHFLPQHSDLEASIANFQNIETCTIEQFVTYKRIATVAVPFMKDVHSRFVSYLGRQGQPDLNKTEIVVRHLESLKKPQP